MPGLVRMPKLICDSVKLLPEPDGAKPRTPQKDCRVEPKATGYGRPSRVCALSCPCVQIDAGRNSGSMCTSSPRGPGMYGAGLRLVRPAAAVITRSAGSPLSLLTTADSQDSRADRR